MASDATRPVDARGVVARKSFTFFHFDFSFLLLPFGLFYANTKETELQVVAAADKRLLLDLFGSISASCLQAREC